MSDLDSTGSLATEEILDADFNKDNVDSFEPKEDEDFSDIERHGILTMPGLDTQGNPVFCFKAANMPSDPRLDFSKLLRYMKFRMDEFVNSDYSIIYLHKGMNSKNKPPFSWLRKVYGSFGRSYKKNLKGLYLVHTTTFIKVMISMFKPLISKKFSKKIHFVKALAELSDIISVETLGVPAEVKRYDDGLKVKANATDSTADATSAVFGAKLADVPLNDKGIPIVVQETMDLIRKLDIGTEGIFRRSVSLKTLNTVKGFYNDGTPVNLGEYNDIQLAAAVMKCFFRELDSPLLTFELYDGFTQFLDNAKEKEEKVDECIGLISQLPAINQEVLQTLLFFLQEVSQQEESNKMGVNNLAIVFGPNILRSKNEAAGFMTTGKCNEAVRFMIQNVDALYANKEV